MLRSSPLAAAAVRSPCGWISYPSARIVLSALVADGILGSAKPKGPVSLRFPLHAVEILFRRLFPEA